MAKIHSWEVSASSGIVFSRSFQRGRKHLGRYSEEKQAVAGNGYRATCVRRYRLCAEDGLPVEVAAQGTIRE